MPFTPLQPPAGLDTDGLRQHGEDQFREVARAWTQVDSSISGINGSISGINTTLAGKVDKVGDTMNGTLNIVVPATGNMNLRLAESTGGWSKYMRTVNGGNLEWVNNANSAVIMSLTDVGALTTIGNMNCTNLSATADVYAGTTGNGQSFRFGASGHRFWYDGSNIVCTAGGFYCPSASGFFAGNLYTGYANVNSGVLYFGNNATRYLQFDGTNYVFGGGAPVTTGGGVITTNGYTSRAGLGGVTNNPWNFYWTSTSLSCYVDNVFLGSVSFVSDPRLKRDVKPVEETVLPLINQLTMVSWRWRDVSIFKDDGKRHYGLMTDDLYRALPETVTDAPDAKEEDGRDRYSTIKESTLVAYLVKAVQELTAKVEALEARL